MSKRVSPGGAAPWVVAAASAAALAVYGAALAVIWLCGRPGAALERLRARRGGDGAFGPIRDYTPGCSDSRDERRGS
jgi:hypothetical protein